MFIKAIVKRMEDLIAEDLTAKAGLNVVLHFGNIDFDMAGCGKVNGGGLICNKRKGSCGCHRHR
jgi:hypothetical protein